MNTEGSTVTTEMEDLKTMSGGAHVAGPDRDPGARPEQSGIAEYARVLWDRKWIIIITTVVAVVGVLGYCVITTKTYSATATVQLFPDVSPLVTQGSATQNPTFESVNVADIIQIMESSTISRIVARTIPNPPSLSATQLGTLSTTDIVQMTASSSNPQLAAAAANAYANDYINFEKGINSSTFKSAEGQIANKVATVDLAISNLTDQIRAAAPGTNITTDEVELGDLEGQQISLENQLQEYQFFSTQGTSTEVGRVLTAATVPSSPSSPHTIEYVLLALIFGLIAGIGLALLVNAISNRRV